MLLNLFFAKSNQKSNKTNINYMINNFFFFNILYKMQMYEHMIYLTFIYIFCAHFLLNFNLSIKIMAKNSFVFNF